MATATIGKAFDFSKKTKGTPSKKSRNRGYSIRRKGKETVAKVVSDTIASVGNGAISTGKKIAYIATIAKDIATSEKTHSFFKKGIIGRALVENAGLTVAEVGAGMLGGYIVTAGAGEIGEVVGSSVAQATPSLALIASGAHFRDHFKALPMIQKILLLLTISTLLGTQWYYRESLGKQGGNIGRVSFEFLGSLAASILASYQVSRLSSGLSLQEYTKRTVQQIGAFQLLGLVTPSFIPSLIRVPTNLIVGMLAYNFSSVLNLAKMMRKMSQSERKDIAGKITGWLQIWQAKALQNAQEARKVAEQKKENLEEHDARIAKLGHLCSIIKEISTGLVAILQQGIEKFNEYRRILAENSDIAKRQLELIDVYHKEAEFEETLKTKGLQFTLYYRERFGDTPITNFNDQQIASITQSGQFHYVFQKNQKKTSLCATLGLAIQANGGGSVVSPIKLMTNGVLDAYVLPELAKIPGARELETLALGFPLTDSVNSAITKDLLSIHAHYLLSFTSTSSGVVKEAASAIVHAAGAQIARTMKGVLYSLIGRKTPTDEVLPSIELAQTFSTKLLDRDEEIDLIENFLKFVPDHYERVSPGSKTVKIAETLSRAIITSLRKGLIAAFSEWRRFDDSPESQDRALTELREDLEDNHSYAMAQAAAELDIDPENFLAPGDYPSPEEAKELVNKTTKGKRPTGVPFPGGGAEATPAHVRDQAELTARLDALATRKPPKGGAKATQASKQESVQPVTPEEDARFDSEVIIAPDDVASPAQAVKQAPVIASTAKTVTRTFFSSLFPQSRDKDKPSKNPSSVIAPLGSAISAPAPATSDSSPEIEFGKGAPDVQPDVAIMQHNKRLEKENADLLDTNDTLARSHEAIRTEAEKMQAELTLTRAALAEQAQEFARAATSLEDEMAQLREENRRLKAESAEQQKVLLATPTPKKTPASAPKEDDQEELALKLIEAETALMEEKRATKKLMAELEAKNQTITKLSEEQGSEEEFTADLRQKLSQAHAALAVQENILKKQETQLQALTSVISNVRSSSQDIDVDAFLQRLAATPGYEEFAESIRTILLQNSPS
jgi:hypothetical protein